MAFDSDPQKYILDLASAVQWREELTAANRKLVVTNGCFDLLHRGHISYLYQARAMGDELLVLINSDASVKMLKGASRPLITELDRGYALCALKPVSRVVIFDSPRCAVELAALRPDIYVKAGDYSLESLDISEKNALENNGAKIIFVPFAEGFSTTGIVNKINAQKA